jgi:hypothetical protein
MLNKPFRSKLDLNSRVFKGQNLFLVQAFDSAVALSIKSDFESFKPYLSSLLIASRFIQKFLSV